MNTTTLPYSIFREGDVRDVERMQDGNLHRAYHYAIVDSSGNKIAVPELIGKKLNEDYLLYTRFPLDTRRQVVLMSGLHGPSIRGIAQLLWQIERKDIEIIRKKIPQPHMGFQAIFRVRGLKDDGSTEKLTTVPTEISLLSSEHVLPVLTSVKL